jgi:tRNA-Thr(GGU) m(6)t(6)A37 methyltransferase TsaA
MEFVMRPIGTIYSPFTEASQTPIQPSRSLAIGQVSVFPKYAEGLADLEGFSHILLLYAFHCSKGYELKVKPFLDNTYRGLFATRYPRRPNPIGLSLVCLKSVNENNLVVEGVDVLNGTPLLDIKPYVPEFDIRTGVRAGWYETRSKE